MSAGRDLVLVLNAGSSSLKFQAFALGAGTLEPRLRGQVEAIGEAPRFAAAQGDGTPIDARPLGPAEAGTAPAALAWLIGWLRARLADSRLLGVGHRVVHGGPDHSAPVRIDAAVLARLEALGPLAPLHQPHNVAPVRALGEALPGLPQVACFDTAFHRTQPIEAELFGLPRSYFDEGVRRYGFHGLSYASIARTLPGIAPAAAAGRTIVAHLGAGVSMCALQAGRSVATTMGFTALDGLPMGTRCGGLDPGVVLWLAREKRMSPDAIEALLYRESGLLGLSGVSADMRVLLASDAPGARLAIDYFTYRIARETGSLAAALGGLDAFVFTAGIGERSAPIRAAVVERCAWLGLALDPAANAAGGPRLSPDGARVPVWCIPTDEERVIAEQTVEVLGLG